MLSGFNFDIKVEILEPKMKHSKTNSDSVRAIQVSVFPSTAGKFGARRYRGKITETQRTSPGKEDAARSGTGEPSGREKGLCQTAASSGKAFIRELLAKARAAWNYDPSLLKTNARTSRV